MPLENLMDDLRGTSKPTEKIEILKKYHSPTLQKLLKLMFDDSIKFHVKMDEGDFPPAGTQSIEEAEEAIVATLDKITGQHTPKQNKARLDVLLSILNAGSQDFVLGILDKKLKTGIGRRGVLAVYPDLFEVFKVQLANKLEPGKKYRHSEVRWSYKLDGLRCVALREKDRWTYTSRTGKSFHTLTHLDHQLEEIYRSTGRTFHDGEIYSHGLPFEIIQGAVMRKKDPKGAQDLEYHVFMSGLAEDFRNQDSSKFEVPLMAYKDVRNVVHKSVSLAEVTQGYGELLSGEWSLDQFAEHFPQHPLAVATSQGYEGIILRDADLVYDFKRSNALLKMKPFDTTDCRILEIIGDWFPFIEDGQQKEMYTTTKLRVLQENGVDCKVGSGFTIDLRKEMWDNQERYVGITIEVQHQGFGSDKRMRFPRFKRFREDKVV